MYLMLSDVPTFNKGQNKDSVRAKHKCTISAECCFNPTNKQKWYLWKVWCYKCSVCSVPNHLSLYIWVHLQILTNLNKSMLARLETRDMYTLFEPEYGYEYFFFFLSKYSVIHIPNYKLIMNWIVGPRGLGQMTNNWR